MNLKEFRLALIKVKSQSSVTPIAVILDEKDYIELWEDASREYPVTSNISGTIFGCSILTSNHVLDMRKKK